MKTININGLTGRREVPGFDFMKLSMTFLKGDVVVETVFYLNMN